MTAENPVTIQLRYLQTLREIGGSQNSTIVFPMPVDLMRPVIDALGSASGASTADSAPRTQAGETNQVGPAPQRELSVGDHAAPVGADHIADGLAPSNGRTEEGQRKAPTTN